MKASLTQVWLNPSSTGSTGLDIEVKQYRLATKHIYTNQIQTTTKTQWHGGTKNQGQIIEHEEKTRR